MILIRKADITRVKDTSSSFLLSLLLQVHCNATGVFDPGSTVPDALCYDVCDCSASLQSQVLLLTKDEHHQQCGDTKASLAVDDWFWSLDQRKAYILWRLHIQWPHCDSSHELPHHSRM